MGGGRKQNASDYRIKTEQTEQHLTQRVAKDTLASVPLLTVGSLGRTGSSGEAGLDAQNWVFS